MSGAEGTRLTELHCLLRTDSNDRLLLDAEIVEAILSDDAPQMRREVCALAEPVDQGVPPNHDPRALPNDKVASFWGYKLAEWLGKGIGDSRVDEILARSLEPNNHLRLVFREVDSTPSGIPFETMIWPKHDGRHLLRNDDRDISIVRSADSLEGLEPTRLDGWDPGWYRIQIVTAPGAQGDAELGRLRKTQPDGTERNGFVVVSTTNEPSFYSSTGETLREVVRKVGPDLIVLNAHGDGAQGMDGGKDGHSSSISALDMAEAVGSPSVAILAMCGSAAGAPRQASAALEMARQGVAIVIGFQGETTKKESVVDFVGTCINEIRETMRQDGAALSAKDWELAVRVARKNLKTEQLTPVMYLHPALCLARAPILDRAKAWKQARRSGKQARRSAGGNSTATPFYVPGQLCFGDATHRWRMPVPVDVGAGVKVELKPGAEHDVLQVASASPSLTAKDLTELAEGWGLQGDGILAHVESDIDARAWAGRAAEMSAVIRALIDILDARPPARVIGLLDRLVNEEWGAHDAAARLIDLEGRRMARLDGWPPLEVMRPDGLSATAKSALDGIRRDPSSMMLPFEEAKRLNGSLLASDEVLRALFRSQRKALLTVRLPELLEDELRKSRPSAVPVVLPGFADVDGWYQESGASNSRSSVVPRCVGVSPRSGRASDVLE